MGKEKKAMKQTKYSLKLSIAILVIIFGISVTLPIVHAQNYQNTITFDNQSGEPALVKVIGTTGQTVEVPKGQSRTVNVAAGEYYLLVRYGSKPDQYSYTKGDPFTVNQTAIQYSVINITLHKVVGGNYPTHPSSHEEFDRTEPNIQPIEDTKKSPHVTRNITQVEDQGFTEKDKEERVRHKAEESLKKLKISDVEILIQELKDKNAIVQYKAAQKLGEMKDAGAIEPLINILLKDEDNDARKLSAQALGEIKDARAVDPLIAALKDGYANVRWFAACALGKIKDKRAIEPLTIALNDINESVRRKAAEALVEIGDTRAVDSLIAALKNNDGGVRCLAASSLGKMKDKQAVEPLIAALKDKEGDVDVMRGVVEALVKLKTAYPDIIIPPTISIIIIRKNMLDSHDIQYMEDTIKRYAMLYLVPVIANLGYIPEYVGIRESTSQIGKGQLIIEYSESEGGDYGLSGIPGKPTFKGTNISCKIKLSHPVSGDLIWEEKIGAGNSSKVRGSLYGDALDNLGLGFKGLKERLLKRYH